MKLGYNTNGLGCHRLLDALVLIAETGYQSVALTLDHHALDPFHPHLSDELTRVRDLLQQHQLSVVIETGARFLLNPRIKHDPTLLSPTSSARAQRLDFLKRSVDIAHALQAEGVSFWSGTDRDSTSTEALWDRLTSGCRELADYAGERNVRLAFEPEPGMFIDTFDRFGELADRVDRANFGLTVDIGHVHCLEPRPIADYLREWGPRIWNIHIEDMRRGVHDHLRFGAGEIDFIPVFTALQEIGYQGCVNVELSRHSHMAPEMLTESYHFLQGILRQIQPKVSH